MTQLPPVQPDLTEAQAHEAIEGVFLAPLLARGTMTEKRARKLAADMVAGWKANAPGSRFMVYAMYYGKANFAGRGIVG